VPFLTLLFARAFKSWGVPGKLLIGAVGILGFVMLSAMAQFMFAEYDVVVTKVYAAYNSTEYQRASNGTITGTIEHEIPEREEVNPIINSNHYEFGLILWGLAIGLGLIYFKVITGT
jgi:hypothetical protein